MGFLNRRWFFRSESLSCSWFRNLHFKVASGVIATIVLLAGLDLTVDYSLHRRELLAEIEASANELSKIALHGLLELAMLGQHPELLQSSLERLGRDSDVLEILLLDLDSEVKFSSRPTNLGKRFSVEAEGCGDCHLGSSSDYPSSILFGPAGMQILRSVTPVPNRKECHACHSPDRRLNGVLVIDFPTSGMKAKLASNLAEMVAKTGLTVLSILLVLGFLMNRVVITRIKKLANATAQIGGQQEIPDFQKLEGPDEIGRLAKSFHEMAGRLTSSIRELEDQKSYLQNLISSLQDGLIVVDHKFQIELANRTACNTWQEAKLEGLHLENTPLRVAMDPVRRTLQTGRPSSEEVEPSVRGSHAYFDIYCSPVWSQQGEVVRVIVLFRDVTERRFFETQISRAERLASVGQLAAGLAHEINNPMASITTCSEGLGRYLESVDRITAAAKEEIAEYLCTIGEAASRCKEITQRLLSVSADDEQVNFNHVDLAEIIRKVAALVEHEAKQRLVTISVTTIPGATILGDEKKLSQLVLNLTLNSLEATNEGGNVLVSVARRDDFIELNVTDDGCGIKEDHLGRLFDPFFTTKIEGRGTGLGLTICEGIVRQHQGQIYVRSQPQKGTQAAVLFPYFGGS